MKKIKDLYYSIWLDIILGAQKNNGKWESNKWFILFFMSFLFGMHYFPYLMFIPKELNFISPFLKIPFFENSTLDRISHGAIIFLLPGLIIHYFLIYHKKKYIVLADKYEFRNGKLFMRYVTITAIMFCIPYIIILIIKLITDN